MKKSDVSIHFKDDTKLCDISAGNYYKYGGEMYLVGYVDGESYRDSKYAVRLRDGRMFHIHRDTDTSVEIINVDIWEDDAL